MFNTQWLMFHTLRTQAQVVSMCVRQPALLSCDSNKLQQRLQHLQHMLGTSYQATVQAVARVPQLLLLPVAALDSKFSTLQQQTGLMGARLGMLLLQEPAVLTLSTQHISATLEHMQELLALQQGSAQLGQLLLRAPRVLLTGHRVLLEQAQELQQYLVLPADTVADLVRRCPDILPAGRAAWLSNISTMLEVLGLLPLQAQAAVVAEPRLLQLKPQEFLERAAKTAYVLRQHGDWQQQLQQLYASDVLLLLRMGDTGLLRLMYLHRAGHSTRLDRAAAAAASSKQQFSKQHPGFISWLNQQQQRQQLLPTPAAAIAAAAAASAAAAAAAEDDLVDYGRFSAAAGSAPAGYEAELLQSTQAPLPGSTQPQRYFSSAGSLEETTFMQQQQAQRQQPRQQQRPSPQLSPRTTTTQQQAAAGSLQRQQSWRQQLQPQPRPKWQPPPEEQQDPQQQDPQQQQQQARPGWEQQQPQPQPTPGSSSSGDSSRQPALEVVQSRR